MLQLWRRIGLTPRFGIIIVLTLIATKVLEEVVLVKLIPTPKIALYTRDWMAERTLEAVRIATVTAPERRPEVLIERAVKGMLPKNRLGRKMYKKLFVYAGAEHPHTAQQPKELKF